MIVHKPKDLAEFLAINSTIRRDSHSPYLAFFRGESADRPITPGVNRKPEYSKDEILEKEKKLFDEFLISEQLGFKLHQHFLRDKFKYAQKWYNLFQAQHLGLKTRLTDWTQSYENALSFMLQSTRNSDKDGVLWVYKCPDDEQYIINFNNSENKKYFDIDPFELDKTLVIKHYSMFDDEFFVSGGEVRRFRQFGSFIISANDDIKESIEKIPTIEINLEKIILSPKLKEELSTYINPELGNYMYDKEDEKKLEEFKSLNSKIENLNNKHF